MKPNGGNKRNLETTKQGILGRERRIEATVEGKQKGNNLKG